MKKIFDLKPTNKKPERQLEAIKSEIRKYMKRERKKKLPENATYWDFDCRLGLSEEEAKKINVTELTAALDALVLAESSNCYIEILAKPVTKVVEDKA